MKPSLYILVFGLILLIGAACRKSEPKEESFALGTILVELNLHENVIRKSEALAGNFTCDAVKTYIETKGHTLDFVVYNSGTLRYDHEKRPTGIFPAGIFYNTDVSEIYPFENTLSIVTMSGAQIKEMFERSVAQYPNAKGPFLQVSQGLSVFIDTLKSPQLINLEGTAIVSAGSRIDNIQLNGVDIDPSAFYKVGMPEFIAAGNDGFVTMLNLSESNKLHLGELETNAITDYVILNSPVNVIFSNRLVFI